MADDPTRFESARATVTLGKVPLAGLKMTGKGTCKGGVNPMPPLHDYPLLCWMRNGHPVHGPNVFTEDGRASVADIATALPETPDIARLAARFGTTEEHCRQAIAYAIKAGVLG
jgi:hypothetical protein